MDTAARDDAPPTHRMRRERETVHAMLALYCRGNHGRGPGLCHPCSKLQIYVDLRLARCPFAPDKPTCANCTVHCYRADMRERIREVMRWAGPRMTWRHPVMALWHLIDGRRAATGSPASRGTASPAPAPSRTPPG